VFTANAAFAQSHWKEIPVGYNMPKSVMAAASPSTMATTPFPRAPKDGRYTGEGRDMNHPWEIEFHGGGFWNVGGVSGQSFALPTAATFSSLGGIGPQSLQVTSYFFGSGANLYNQFTQGPFGLSNTITPLDPTLKSQFGRRHGGPSIGVRLGRDIGPWFGIEFSADWNTTPISIDDKQLLAIESTRSSFANSFTEFETSVVPGGTALAISSSKRSAGSQLFWTGVVNVNLKPDGKTIPYLTFGGGAVSNIGPAPHGSLLGFYAFDFAGPHAENDVVDIQARAPRTQWVAVLGIGAKYYATPRWGLRFDFRDHVTSNSIDTVLFATPNVATLSPPGAVAFFGPSAPNNLVFSNDPSIGPSTLSGPAIKGIRTFKGNGITNQFNASAGVFYRF
jgi:hypothetical protein